MEASFAASATAEMHGDTLATMIDLSEAAGQGDLAARLEMGRRFKLGRGVDKSEAAALSYFRGIVAEYENISAHDPRASLVASAYLEMAHLCRTGVLEENIAPDPAQAFSFLHHAASFFGDPTAQTELAKILLNGDGITKNPRAGAQWLLSASRKGYAPAQALLGDLLWRGADGVKRVAGDGLGLLAIASHNAAGDDKAWVSKLFEEAHKEAEPVDILEANAFIVQELSASHSTITSDLLINGRGSEQRALAISSAKPPSTDFGPEMGTAISGTSKALSELGATPMGLPQNIKAPVSVNSKEQAPVGVLQMYKPQGSLDTLKLAGMPN